METQKLPYWMAIGESELLKFSELAHLMAKAMHPSDAELQSYGVARVNLDDELPREVETGRLLVRNASGLGRHQFPFGDALKRAVMMPHDLRGFLADRGIELRLRPHGSGPTFWTITNAAVAIAEQENWHTGARGSLIDAMLEAVKKGELRARDPHSDLPCIDANARSDWELLTPDDVNVWLTNHAASYRWNWCNSVITQSVGPIAIECAPTPVNAWDDHNLRRLLSESQEAGATQKKLADQYGVTRQRIGALLKKAQDKFSTKKTAISIFANPMRKK